MLVPRMYLLGTLVTNMVLYGFEIWDDSVPKFTSEDYENVQKGFLLKFLEVEP